MVFVKGDLVKLAVVAAILLVVIVLAAGLASGYFKMSRSGNATSGNVVGTSGNTQVAGNTAAAPSPSPPPAPQGLANVSEPRPQPEAAVQAPTPLPVAGTAAGIGEAGTPGQGQLGGTQAGSAQATGAPSGQPAGPGGWSGPTPASPLPAGSPLPTAAPAKPGTRPEAPAAPSTGLTPYEAGWRAILERLLETLPLIFPGSVPGQHWYLAPSSTGQVPGAGGYSPQQLPFSR